jgi:hypothetical protein
VSGILEQIELNACLWVWGGIILYKKLNKLRGQWNIENAELVPGTLK